jgi:hypothetical protein
MLKLVFLPVALLVALALAAAFVPLRGATVLDRWAAAPSTSVFLERGWREVKVAMGLQKEKSRPARVATTRPARPAQRAARPAPPAEHHSETDRAELDRIVAEHARP